MDHSEAVPCRNWNWILKELGSTPPALNAGPTTYDVDGWPPSKIYAIIGPVGPVAPAAPVSPKPVGPKSPVGPVSPMGPVKPPYGKLFHSVTPSPILNKFVSVSNPSSVCAKTVDAVCQTDANPLRNWN